MKKALIIGINDYKDAPLKGCINDTVSYKNVLANCGYSINVLTDTVATKQNIIEEIESTLYNTTSNDCVVITFSGHGSQVPDKSGDEKDGLDECLLPYGYTWDNVIIDDDIDIILNQYKGASVEIVLDACHSGSGTRNVLLDWDTYNYNCQRFVQPPIELFDRIVNPDTVRINKIVSNVITWSGCRDDQTSADANIGGSYNGVFSYALCSNIGNNRSQTLKATRHYISSHSYSQVPQLQCSFAAKHSQQFERTKSLLSLLKSKF